MVSSRALIMLLCFTEKKADLRCVGKQWHAQKSAFRPKPGQTSYEKRTQERKAMAAMKAKEKEMKDEKEDERQVESRCVWEIRYTADTKLSAAHTSNQGQEGSQRGERAV